MFPVWLLCWSDCFPLVERGGEKGALSAVGLQPMQRFTGKQVSLIRAFEAVHVEFVSLGFCFSKDKLEFRENRSLLS